MPSRVTACWQYTGLRAGVSTGIRQTELSGLSATSNAGPPPPQISAPFHVSMPHPVIPDCCEGDKLYRSITRWVALMCPAGDTPRCDDY